MKRLHIVGKSKDNKKIYLARASDAKFGSMEIPIGRKLLGLVKEAEEAKRAKTGKPSPEQEAREAKAAAKEAEALAKRSEKTAEDASATAREAAERLREAERRAKEAESRAEKAEQSLQKTRSKAAKLEDELRRAASPRQQEERPAPAGGLPVGGLERAVGVAELEGLHGVRAVIRRTEEAARDDVTASVEPPAVPTPSAVPAKPEPAAGEPEKASEPEPEPPERPRLEPMPASRLSPAEIQTLLRAGRGVRSVAKQADVPVDWVRRLAAPIEAERLGVVTQLFQSFQERTRLGRSSVPVGPAIVENLRDKGVRFPERVIEEGWSATRTDGRVWRVRFTYESRGRNQRADWRFDPQTRTVEAVNTLATELGFRSPEDSDGTSASAAAGIAAAMRPRAIRGRSAAGEPAPKGSGARAGRGRGAKGRGGGGTRKKPAAKKAGAKKSSATRKKAGSGKKAAGRQRTTGKKAGGRKKASGKKKSGRSGR